MKIKAKKNKNEDEEEEEEEGKSEGERSIKLVILPNILLFFFLIHIYSCSGQHIDFLHFFLGASIRISLPVG
jgi:hypothetical protein